MPGATRLAAFTRGFQVENPYYYLLQYLDTVTGLIKKNGTLAEA